ncbi:glutaredoxin-like protein, YruB-family [Thermoanaerobacter mathranii subsp. mathranii str. A3]|jgi:glutaredoxin-like YruB-family protein|uniref:Glutaredoxin-like protein, YruB-family n=2 Tax=Thermoanaerobacter TaxID=1754 RepID=D3T6B1_THEIA|nr:MULTISPECIES: glutaredoxin domain-containing protein [Thermoanaerobacter]ADD03505.1 glutaredoxin-like protein, YruB-family [Thermoanaerobacter italicus Ab9]ADH61875.1 glutaredoxin-like protein, YruB-family [Thermoanaerobacter mathranii subsp. mathranii str. A3]MBT1279703.1 glutaredoxin [Thermoanaerobacter sp. CM-CNRG TB177]
MLEFIKDAKHFEEIKNKEELFMLMFYSNSSQKSLEALEVIKKFSEDNPKVPVYVVNASEIRDIHPQYGIKVVPSVILFKDKEPWQFVFGLQNKEYYEKLLVVAPSKVSDGKGQKVHRVTVYTTPSCPWCNATKAYLRQHNIPFREIDVSKNPSAAAELVRRSGQRGVPQTDIDGTIVVGFDKAKLNQLLGITDQ